MQSARVAFPRAEALCRSSWVCNRHCIFTIARDGSGALRSFPFFWAAASQSTTSRAVQWSWSRLIGLGIGTSSVLVAVGALMEPEPDETLLPHDYDAEALEVYWRCRPWNLRKRKCRVFIELMPCLWKFSARALTGWPQDKSACAAAERELACTLREAIIRLGPAFIKIGQALAIRPDLLPEAALKELQRLCDDCAPIGWEAASWVLSDSLGSSPETVFDFGIPAGDEPQPVAAASLGQVYKWRRRLDGELVAVKVQRPDIVEAVARDIYILRCFAATAHRWMQRLTNSQVDYVMLVDAWATGTFGELDYEREMANQEYFRVEFQRRKLSRIRVPRVFADTTTRRVLVTEWIEGPRLADCAPDVVRSLVPIGVECFLVQMMDMGKFHSDPHPGNLLVSGQGTGQQLVLLDFGLVAELPTPSREQLALATVHLISADFDALLDDLVLLEFLPANVDRCHVLPPLRRVLEQGMRSGGDLRRRAKNFGAIADDLGTVFFELPFQVPGYFALITRALSMLEGLALVGNPDFDIFFAAYPYSLGKARELLGTRRTAGLVTAAAAQAAQSLTSEQRFELFARRGDRRSNFPSPVASGELPVVDVGTFY